VIRKILSLLFVNFVAIVGLASFGNAQRSPRHEETIGLLPGDAAPTFKARDQYGHDQGNKTVAGANGTVLLFFRSADW
jgi:hypothetical protein